MPVEISPGQFADTVGDILARDPVWPGEGVPDAPAERVTPPRLEGQPEFPEPGIYFGMQDSDYHAIHAFSASGAKKLLISTMDYWAESPLNPDREIEEEDSIFKALGRAYHARVCEGCEAYEAMYAIGLDRKDYPDAMVTTDEIKAAIEEAGEKCAGRIPTGAIKIVETKAGNVEKPITRAAKKEDWIAQLLEISPDAQIWDAMIAAHTAENAGKTMISAKSHRRIEMAAKMIEGDDELRLAFSGGYAEVSIFYFDKRTGCPCKARLDYIKMLAFSDLKSFSGKVERPVERAIDFEIAARRHFIPVVHYGEAIEAAREMVREHGDKVVHGDVDAAWIAKWAGVKKPPVALFVFQKTGNAPVTRGRVMHRGSVFTITEAAVHALRKKWIECTKVYGVLPWLDRAPIRETVDEEIPLSATDFGSD